QRAVKDWLPGAGVPHPEMAVLASSEQGCAVRVERDRADATSVARQRQALLQLGQVPDLDLARTEWLGQGPGVAGTGREGPSIAREAQREDRLRVALQGGPGLPGRQVPEQDGAIRATGGETSSLADGQREDRAGVPDRQGWQLLTRGKVQALDRPIRG